jgi:hypothetical protein
MISVGRGSEAAWPHTMDLLLSRLRLQGFRSVCAVCAHLQVYKVLEPVLLEKNKAEEKLKVGDVGGDAVVTLLHYTRNTCNGDDDDEGGGGRPRRGEGGGWLLLDKNKSTCRGDAQGVAYAGSGGGGGACVPLGIRQAEMSAG